MTKLLNGIWILFTKLCLSKICVESLNLIQECRYDNLNKSNNSIANPLNFYLSGQICRWKNQLARTRGRKEALTNDLGQKIPRYPWSRNSCFNHFRSYWTRRNLRQRYWHHICHVQSGGSIVPSCSEIDLKTLRIFQSPYTPTHWFQYPILTYSQCWSTPPTNNLFRRKKNS